MFNIHIFTSGKKNFDTYRKTLKHFSDISHIIILKEAQSPSDIEESIGKVQADCKALEIDFSVVEYPNNNLEEGIQKIMDIRKRYPSANLYFNITGGKKNDAIMAFMASIWVNGRSYYWLENEKVPIEFPVPKISVNELAKNKLHQRILEILLKEGTKSQSELRTVIRKNPNNNKDLSAQVLSQSIGYLEDYELIKKEHFGRESEITITLSGRLAYSIIQIK